MKSRQFGPVATPPRRLMTAVTAIAAPPMRMLTFSVLAVASVALFMPSAAHLWLEPLATIRGHWPREIAGFDFKVFYAAAHQIRLGHPSLMYSPDALAQVRGYAAAASRDGSPLPYLNPPIFALLLTPLTMLPFGVAYTVWTVLNAGLVAALAWLVWDACSAIDRRQRFALVLLTITALPVAFTLRLGQFSLILAASWMTAYRELRAQHDGRAGLALAPLLIKPDLIIVVAAMLAWQRPRAFRTLAAATLVAVALSVGVIGWRSALAYPGYLYSNATRHLPGTEPEIMFGWNALFELSGLAETLSFVAASGLTLYFVVKCLRRQPLAGVDHLASGWLLITVASLLLDPHLYFQDLAILTPIACVYAGEAIARGRRGEVWLVGLGWFILSFGLAPNRTWGINAFGIFLAGSLLLLMARILAGHREQPARRDPITSEWHEAA